MNKIAIIPARLQSTRLPQKLMIQVHGKSILQHVYDRVVDSACFDRVIIACDDQIIEKSAQAFGAEVYLTNKKHISGTDRIAQVVQEQNLNGIIVNVQGDEPLIGVDTLAALLSCFDDPSVDICSVFREKENTQDYNNPNCVKLVTDSQHNALYFSRASIPFDREGKTTSFKQHVGIYAFKSSVLLDLVELKPSTLELTEKLEQLRWLENGYSIRMVQTKDQLIGIDTEEDLDRFEQYLDQRKL